MGRLGQPDEIARAAVYLASEDAAFVTGTSFVIDGGLTMQ
jgi:glucose 1-dehydrogenase